MERLIGIGDIHGEISKLNDLLKILSPQKNDTLVFLGDYIDRGTYSKEVVERLLELTKITNCIFLKGNHEYLLLKANLNKDEKSIATWLFNGGMETLQSYGNYENIFKLHKCFFENLKKHYLTEKYLFVHAGINPDKPLNKQTENDLLWIREEFLDCEHNLQQKIIFGHTVFDKPFIAKNKIGINTGCGIDKNGKLTAIICDEEKFISI